MILTVNRLPPKVTVGTIGEVLVQLKLLMFGVESFPPLKDSGNDLVAYFGSSFAAIQVKTKQAKGWSMPNEETLYHVLALVDLDKNHSLDNSIIFLLTRKEAEEQRRQIGNGTLADRFCLSGKRLEELRELDQRQQLSTV